MWGCDSRPGVWTGERRRRASCASVCTPCRLLWESTPLMHGQLPCDRGAWGGSVQMQMKWQCQLEARRRELQLSLKQYTTLATIKALRGRPGAPGAPRPSPPTQQPPSASPCSQQQVGYSQGSNPTPKAAVGCIGAEWRPSLAEGLRCRSLAPQLGYQWIDGDSCPLGWATSGCLALCRRRCRRSPACLLPAPHSRLQASQAVVIW